MKFIIFEKLIISEYFFVSNNFVSEGKFRGCNVIPKILGGMGLQRSLETTS